MPVYEVNHKAAAGSNLPMINLTGGASNRLGVGEVTVGAPSAVADATGDFGLIRTTSVGVGGTALTEEKRDPLTSTPVGAGVGGTFTTDPATSGVDLLPLPLHQRNTALWQGWEGREIFSVASANNGLMLRSREHTGTPQIRSGIAWKE